LGHLQDADEIAVPAIADDDASGGVANTAGLADRHVEVVFLITVIGLDLA